MQGRHRSAIDFVVVTNRIMDRITSMEVDDRGQHLIESDHNLIWIEVDVKRQTERAPPSKEDSWKIGPDTEWGQFDTVIEEEMGEWDPA